MASRHAVLLNPLESALPRWLPFYKKNEPVSPLESALTIHSQVIQNTATLSLVESALTACDAATPLESALTKNTGVGGGSSHSETRHSFTPRGAEGPLYSAVASVMEFRSIHVERFAVTRTVDVDRPYGSRG